MNVLSTRMLTEPPRLASTQSTAQPTETPPQILRASLADLVQPRLAPQRPQSVQAASQHPAAQQHLAPTPLRVASALGAMMAILRLAGPQMRQDWVRALRWRSAATQMRRAQVQRLSAMMLQHQAKARWRWAVMIPATRKKPSPTAPRRLPSAALPGQPRTGHLCSVTGRKALAVGQRQLVNWPIGQCRRLKRRCHRCQHNSIANRCNCTWPPRFGNQSGCHRDRQ